MSANGQLKNNELSPITGGGQLRNDAARAWNAFAAWAKQKHGVNVEVTDSYRVKGKPGDLDKGRWSQWAAWERYQRGGNLAARPGTSNHGLGTALDIPGATQQLIRAHGAEFGWKKTEAFNEPWHYCYVPGHYPAVEKYSVPPTIKQGDRNGYVKLMKTLLGRHGFWPKTWPKDGGFGGRTATQLKKFQAAKRLVVDGTCGPGTWHALSAKPVAVKPTPKPPAPKPTPKPPTPKPKPPAPKSKYFADIYGGDTKFDAKTYASKHDLIVLKATEGKTFQDPEYIDRVKQARAAGLTVFSYHFARPSNNKPEEEARNFAALVKKAGTKPTDRLVLDWEDPKFQNRNGDAWISAFCKEMGKLGLTVRVLYSGGWYLPGTITVWPKDHTGKPLRYWHAAYTTKPEANVPSIAKPNLWACQFTDGSVGNQPHQLPGLNPGDVSYLV